MQRCPVTIARLARITIMKDDYFPQAPSLSPGERDKLVKWADLDFAAMADEEISPQKPTGDYILVNGKGVPEMRDKTAAEIQADRDAMVMFSMMGAYRNIDRHAEAWGPVLIAKLVEEGWLEPGGDPSEALDDLFASCKPKTKTRKRK